MDTRNGLFNNHKQKAIVPQAKRVVAIKQSNDTDLN
jgi:hypothetical protein